eukprot:TRINITY_DN3165_c3_g1_i1.p1 TRINITY_DN3165_c3_g1~~TRINITY_DN3165_c3_g1_i1.p1  ORF type:complete len:299 (+),score=118.12 TRINITY_DN3165_c3_g1_i1:37-897(+)
MALPPPGPITLYYDDGKTEPYTPADLQFQHSKETGIALVTFNTPDTMNALQPILIQEMLFVLEQAKRDDTIKVIVWTGAGRAFSAGAALKPRSGKKVKFPKELMKQYKQRGMAFSLLNDIALGVPTLAHWDCPKINIAAVHGAAIGGATNMVCCNWYDFTVVAEDTKFKYPFVKLGITPELGSSRMLPQLIGYAKAKELLLGGEFFYAKDAHRLGLINEVVATKEQVLPKALELAQKYASCPNTFALQSGKKLINSHLREEMGMVMKTENAYIRECVKRGSSLGKL